MKSACEKLPLDQVSSLIEKDPHPQLWYKKLRIKILK